MTEDAPDGDTLSHDEWAASARLLSSIAVPTCEAFRADAPDVMCHAPAATALVRSCGHATMFVCSAHYDECAETMRRGGVTCSMMTPNSEGVSHAVPLRISIEWREL